MFHPFEELFVCFGRPADTLFAHGYHVEGREVNGSNYNGISVPLLLKTYA